MNVPLVAKTPREAADHFTWFTLFAGTNSPASSQQTRSLLGWEPTQPELLTDLDQIGYFS